MLEEALRISLIESKMNNNNNEIVLPEVENQEDGLDAKFNVPANDLPDDDDGEEGDEINQAILLSLELQEQASSSASSSSLAS